jgi:hypothetical protein
MMISATGRVRNARVGLAMFIFAGMTAWGQEQNAQSAASNTTDTEKVDRAAAYYHYAMAHMYSELALRSKERQAENANKANEHYNEAVKADPRTPPMMRSGFHAGILPGVIKPAPQKADPSTPQR